LLCLICTCWTGVWEYFLHTFFTAPCICYLLRTSFHSAAVITHPVIRAAFPLCFFQVVALTVISQLYWWSIDKIREALLWDLLVKTVTQHPVTSIPLFQHVFPELLTWLITYFQWLSQQQETRPYIRCFLLGCCDHSTRSSQMERDPKEDQKKSDRSLNVVE
jgi:hypothetical protein